MERKLFVGDVVKINVGVQNLLLGNVSGVAGVVYEEYDLGWGPGVSIIFENGEYDGFSPKEQDLMVTKVGHDRFLTGYKFQNVMLLTDNYRFGIFNNAFKIGKECS